MSADLFKLIKEQVSITKLADISRDRKLPSEIFEMVRQKEVVPNGPMTLQEANRHQIDLVNIRSHFHEESESDLESVQYSFCEH
ncbi:hypothetical protein BJ878DRAFT_490458 [Calycina marina]|uniref:Uncharacterized protein n=1 Tax=Calycina marina TaxID=1763456 RepID=A0A9P7Z9M3_9HELO|nr:hypothetical protein BJ878DRAFT_490458 [Calycina marina]